MRHLSGQDVNVIDSKRDVFSILISLKNKVYYKSFMISITFFKVINSSISKNFKRYIL